MPAPQSLVLMIAVKGFSERLRTLRLARGLKQNRLAELLGIPARSYNRWERGTYVPHVEMLVKLADILQVSMDELIGRTAAVSEPRFRNAELHQIVEQVDQLPDLEQQAAIVLLDSLLKKTHIERLGQRRKAPALRAGARR